jgi:hypothetical protein
MPRRPASASSCWGAAISVTSAGFAAPAEGLLSLAPDNWIVSTDAQLYVLNRRGVFTFRSKHIGRLHQALEQHLNGTLTEQSLLASVQAAQAPAVRSYLQKLREAGALTGDSFESREDGAVTLEMLRNVLPLAGRHGPVCATVVAGRRRIFVALRGPLRRSPGKYTSQIVFCSAEEIRKKLLALSHRRMHSHAITYVVDADDTELEQRLATAHWLLNLEPLAAPEHSWFQVYMRPGQGLTLEKVLRIRDFLRSEGNSIADRLQLIAPADVDQIPLVCLEAKHALFAVSAVRFGLDDRAVRAELLREFVVRASLGDSVLGGPVAGSLLALRAKALEAWAREHAVPRAAPTEVDLLTEEYSHPDLKYLQSVLRLRRATIPATTFVSPEGFYVYRQGGASSASFLQWRAVRDLLLSVAWSLFYPDSSIAALPSNSDDFTSFAPLAQIRATVAAIETQLRESDKIRELVYRRVPGLGVTAYAGGFEPGKR